MDPKRALASGSVSATGLVVVVMAAIAVRSGVPSTVDLGLVALGVVVGLALVGAGGALLLLTDELSTGHVIRVAGWNTLGVVVLGLVLVLALASPAAVLPPYVIANVLGVSAVAHVLIGVNDVRRIRVAALARERQKLAVVNRVIRHNLRNDSQVIIGYAEALRERVSDDEAREMADSLVVRARELSTMNEKTSRFQSIVEGDTSGAAADLQSLVESAVAELGDEYPDARIDVEVPSVDVAVGDDVRAAIRELVENGIVHAGGVTVAGTRRNGTVRLDVTDDGPGIPEGELRPLDDDVEITQLEHGTGIGLWIAKTAVETNGGELAFGTTGEGTTVSVSLPTA